MPEPAAAAGVLPRRPLSWLRRPPPLARAALVALLAAAAAELIFLQTPVITGLVLAGLVLGAVALARRVSLVGPLFFYDLVRLARKGRSTFVRVGYAAVLL